MPAPRPGRSLFRQFVGPVVGLLAAAVLANVGFSAWLAARRAAAAARVGQAQVTAAIRDVRVALSPQVLDALARLTGSHFVVWDPATRKPGPTTLPAGAIDERRLGALAADIGGTADIDGVRYRIGSSRPEGIRPETVLVLTPLEDATSLAWNAVWPVLAVAAATLAVLVPLSLRLTRRLAGRITGVERLVARIAGGEFGETLPEPGPEDEIGRLVAGVNRMSATLRSLRDTLVASERQRLVGQLAAGFAHELRNAVTGAKLAIDLHRRRCPAEDGSDESLRVASRQLDVLEEEVRGLLALGRRRETLPSRVDVGMLVADVRDLAGPRCDHAGVRMECGAADEACILGRADALRAALVNLVLNAIDAAGRGGLVRLDAARTDRGVRIVVEDDGPGPPETIRDSLHEPFVTGKPEGIGLGLTIARTVAEEHGGALEWTRAEGRTRFTMTLPADAEGVAGVPGAPTP